MTKFSEEQIREVIKEEISRLKEGSITAEDIRDDFPLFDFEDDGKDNLGLDSLDGLEIGMSIEDQFDVTIPEDLDYSKLQTVNALTTYVVRLQAWQVPVDD